MLVLGRKPGESVLIGAVTVRVLEVRGRQVRLGIDAPRDVPVARAELSEFWVDAPEGCQSAQELEETLVTCS